MAKKKATVKDEIRELLTDKTISVEARYVLAVGSFYGLHVDAIPALTGWSRRKVNRVEREIDDWLDKACEPAWHRNRKLLLLPPPDKPI